MKRTFIITSDSNYYYYLILENGEQIAKGESEWCIYEDDTNTLKADLEKEYGRADFVYWI